MREAMPSAYVAAASVSIGRPAANERVIASAPSAWTPTTRRRRRGVPEPRPDAVDQRAVADRDGGDRERRQLAGLDRVGHLERERRRAGRDPRVVAVDEQLGIVLGRVRLRGAVRASSKSSPASMTVAPSARIRAILAAVRVARREDDGRDAERPSGVGDALAEVAGRRDDDRPIAGRSSPPPPGRGPRPTSRGP